jgi:hypothetical protein
MWHTIEYHFLREKKSIFTFSTDNLNIEIPEDQLEKLKLPDFNLGDYEMSANDNYLSTPTNNSAKKEDLKQEVAKPINQSAGKKNRSRKLARKK